jgi:hypothetical protein
MQQKIKNALEKYENKNEINGWWNKMLKADSKIKGLSWQQMGGRKENRLCDLLHWIMLVFMAHCI